MATYELLFRVGDSSGPMELGHWKDGMIIAYKRRGEDFTTAEMVTWLGTYGTGTLGAEPAGFDLIPEEHQDHWRRRVGQLNYLLHPAVQAGNAAALEALRALRYPGGYDTEEERLFQIDEIEAKAREADLTRNRITTHGGVDTNWGYGDLAKFGVVAVQLTYEQARSARAGKTNTALNPMEKRKVVARSTWRVKYEEFLSAARILRVRDPNDIVPVDRTLIYPPLQAIEKVVIP